MIRPRVSVVTPFHNTATWLPECIESVLAQTHGDFEYVLVDNASTDGGGKIAESYAARDSRLKVIKTDRLLPQVENYNFALSQISPDTKYCKIVQADDWLYPHFLSASIDLAEQDDGVILVSSYGLESTGVVPIGLTHDKVLMPGRDAGRAYFTTGLYAFGSPTAQLWRADVVRRRQPFYDVRIDPFEDADVCFELLRDARFGFVHQILSYTRREEGSIFDSLKRFGWNQAIRLAILRRWGHHYLDDDEFDKLHDQWWREYRKVLVEGTARRAGDTFWRFHRRMMAAADMKAVADGMTWPVVAWYLDRLGNPKRTFGNIIRRVVERLSGT